MKEPLAVIVLFLLVALGWNQSFETHYAAIRGQNITRMARSGKGRKGSAAYSGRQEFLNPTPVPDRSWMWAPTAIDAPETSATKEGRGRR